jgi:hypothetical protein
VFVKQQNTRNAGEAFRLQEKEISHAVAGGITRLHQAEPFSAAKTFEAPRRFLLF